MNYSKLKHYRSGKFNLTKHCIILIIIEHYNQISVIELVLVYPTIANIYLKANVSFILQTCISTTE